MVLLVVTLIIITPALALIIWRNVLSLNTKSKVHSGHWFLVVAVILFLGWYSIKRYEANGLISAFEYKKNNTVNGLKNPLGLEKIKSFHIIKLTRDYGEAEAGRKLGYIVIYQVSNVVSDIVLKTKGKYLSLADIPANGKHWIVDSRHPDISCYPQKSDYYWQPIFQAPKILIQHTNLTEKDVFQVVEKYLNLNVIDSSYQEAYRKYPFFWISTKNLANHLSKQTYVYPEIQRGNLYTHFFDPINHLYVVTLQIDAVRFTCKDH